MVMFQGQFPLYTLNRAIYCPLRYNFRGIDALVVYLDLNKRPSSTLSSPRSTLISKRDSFRNGIGGQVLGDLL